jgi:phytoene/squalene synthetase
MSQKTNTNESLASSITRKASKQSYYTIRLFADRKRVADAYRAYAYFRWVDDVLDSPEGTFSGKIAFIDRQKTLLEACYQADAFGNLSAEETMLSELVSHDTGTNSGLQIYLRNMMGVMDFDARRLGRMITEVELSDYSRMLASAVTEAIFYFISHDTPPPDHESRYLAVTGAHITHMLRDTYEDTAAGYFNIPIEYLQSHGMKPQDVKSLEYQEWVCSRVQLARKYFKAGRDYLSQIKSLRCRLAGLAYTARFEWLLEAIEQDNYCLRSEYNQRRSPMTGLWMIRSIVFSIFHSPLKKSLLSYPEHPKH